MSPALNDLCAPALLLIDLQNFFCAPHSPAFVSAWSEAEPQALRLLAAFEDTGWPVYFTRHVHPEGDAGGVMARFFNRLIRDDDDLAQLTQGWRRRSVAHGVFAKHRYSALSNPELRAHLDAHDAVLLAGVQTHYCLLATALDAAAHGVVPIVVADACADRRPELHRSTLEILAAGHAHVTTTDQVLDTWPELRARGGHV